MDVGVDDDAGSDEVEAGSVVDVVDVGWVD
jgi:hypothetical protein